MSSPGAPARGPRNMFGLAILIAVGVGGYVLLTESDSEADYAAAVARIGRDNINRLVTATMPPAIAGHCIDRFGQNQALVDAVVAYNTRTGEAQRALIARIEATAAMTADEKRAVEAAALSAAVASLPDEAACSDAIRRIQSGAFDLEAMDTERDDAQAGGS